MNESEISVTVIEQSGRSENLINPLQATGMDIQIDPSDPYKNDIVILDRPDKEFAFEVLKKPLHGSKVVFRMRGDPFYGIDEWIDNPLKVWLAKTVIMPGVDGCITITPHHARLFERKTGVESGVAQLPCYPEQWPSTVHKDSELRILTLTNAVYWPKIKPLIDAMPVVERALEDIGGDWHICGDGNYEDELEGATEGYEHIDFLGYVDAKQQMEWANCMVHLSNLDGWPNAILEGMSGQLPVITNDHHAFTDKDRPNIVVTSDDELNETLYELAEPRKRKEYGNVGERYVLQNHTDGILGEQYVSYFKSLLSKKNRKFTVSKYLQG